MKTVFILIFAATRAFTGWAQDFKKDLIKINNSFKAQEVISLKVDYNIILDRPDARPYETRKATLIKKGGNYYYQDESAEFMANGNYIVTLNKEAKRINITRRESKVEPKEFEQLASDLFIKALDAYENTKYTDVSENEARYTLLLKGGKFSKVDITYNKTTMSVKQIRYSFRDELVIKNKEGKHKVFAVINYVQQDSNENAIAPFFSETRYFRVLDNKLTVNEKFKSYKVKNESIGI